MVPFSVLEYALSLLPTPCFVVPQLTLQGPLGEPHGSIQGDQP